MNNQATSGDTTALLYSLSEKGREGLGRGRGREEGREEGREGGRGGGEREGEGGCTCKYSTLFSLLLVTLFCIYEIKKNMNYYVKNNI